MAQIKQDPHKLRGFCAELTAHAVFWEAEIGNLHAKLAKLGESWRDDQYVTFQQEVQGLRRSLAKFSDDTQRVVVQLEQDAEKMEKYLRIKGGD